MGKDRLFDSKRSEVVFGSIGIRVRVQIAKRYRIVGVGGGFRFDDVSDLSRCCFRWIGRWFAFRRSRVFGVHLFGPRSEWRRSDRFQIVNIMHYDLRIRVIRAVFIIIVVVKGELDSVILFGFQLIASSCFKQHLQLLVDSRIDGAAVSELGRFRSGHPGAGDADFGYFEVGELFDGLHECAVHRGQFSRRIRVQRPHGIHRRFDLQRRIQRVALCRFVGIGFVPQFGELEVRRTVACEEIVDVHIEAGARLDLFIII
jgi:hypothetical protein